MSRRISQEQSEALEVIDKLTAAGIGVYVEYPVGPCGPNDGLVKWSVRVVPPDWQPLVGGGSARSLPEALDGALSDLRGKLYARASVLECEARRAREAAAQFFQVPAPPVPEVPR